MLICVTAQCREQDSDCVRDVRVMPVANLLRPTASFLVQCSDHVSCQQISTIAQEKE